MYCDVSCQNRVDGLLPVVDHVSTWYDLVSCLISVAVSSLLSQEVLPKIHEDKHYPCTLVGTWNTWYGEQDQAGRKQTSLK